ncbi:MAG: hypothetical protein Q7J27_13015 [Syntrophales bacterium]|nr:hypothetical protein [Syntrophales bacterium]
MSEINKEGFLNGKLEIVQRSNIYWVYANKIKAVMYANNFTHFWIDRSKELQNIMRTKAPDVVGDWYRFQFEGFTITFSLSDDAIRQYQPIVREFSSFGTAVKILGNYENYFSEIIKETISSFPENVDAFSKKHKTGNINLHNVKNFMWKKLGRGLSLIEDVFEHKFHPSYKPCINFFFELRNVAVHNSNIADEKLCELAESEFIKSNGKISCGNNVEWSLSSVLQLNQLVLQILDEADAVICSPLRLEMSPGRRHWYYSEK